MENNQKCIQLHFSRIQCCAVQYTVLYCSRMLYSTVMGKDQMDIALSVGKEFKASTTSQIIWQSFIYISHFHQASTIHPWLLTHTDTSVKMRAINKPPGRTCPTFPAHQVFCTRNKKHLAMQFTESAPRPNQSISCNVCLSDVVCPLPMQKYTIYKGPRTKQLITKRFLREQL